MDEWMGDDLWVNALLQARVSGWLEIGDGWLVVSWVDEWVGAGKESNLNVNESSGVAIPVASLRTPDASDTIRRGHVITTPNYPLRTTRNL